MRAQRPLRHKAECVTDQYGRQPPEVQLLGGQPVGLALGAVVKLVLAQLLLAGEGLQTAVQTDGLSLRPAGLLHTAVLLHNLHGDQEGDHTAEVRMHSHYSALYQSDSVFFLIKCNLVFFFR